MLQLVAAAVCVAVTSLVVLVQMGLFSQKHSYKGKHVLITGGSTGIGYHLAAEFLKLGALVTLVARTESKLQDAKQQLEQGSSREGLLSDRVHIAAADTTDYAKVRGTTMFSVRSSTEVQSLDRLFALLQPSAQTGTAYWHRE